MFKFNKCKNDPLPVWCAPAAAKKPFHAIKTNFDFTHANELFFASFQLPEQTRRVPDLTICRHSPFTAYTVTTSESQETEGSHAATRASAKASHSALAPWKSTSESVSAFQKSRTIGAESSVSDSHAWTLRRWKDPCQSTPVQISPTNPASGARPSTSVTVNATTYFFTTWQTQARFITE